MWNSLVIEGSNDLNMCRDIDIIQEREKQIIRENLGSVQFFPVPEDQCSTSTSLSSLQPSEQDINDT